MVNFPLLYKNSPEINPIKSHLIFINKFIKPPFSYGFPIENGNFSIEHDNFPIKNINFRWSSIY